MYASVWPRTSWRRVYSQRKSKTFYSLTWRHIRWAIMWSSVVWSRRWVEAASSWAKRRLREIILFTDSGFGAFQVGEWSAAHGQAYVGADIFGACQWCHRECICAAQRRRLRGGHETSTRTARSRLWNGGGQAECEWDTLGCVYGFYEIGRIESPKLHIPPLSTKQQT